jgi:hypothetical protein
MTYTFPYKGHVDTWYFPTIPENYKSTDLTQIIRPEFKSSDRDFTIMRVILNTHFIKFRKSMQ